MSILDTMLKMTEVTQGRIDSRQVFRDFMTYSALFLSNRTDPAHLEERKRQQEAAVKEYRPQELEVFMETLKALANEICRNVDSRRYIDILGPVHQRLHPKSGPLKQDFTPAGVAALLSRIIEGELTLPEKGYFTLMDPACGSGVLCLAFADEVDRQGYNPSEQMVVQATDLDSHCAHMTYIQLSFYGIPAVIVAGNTISLEEYDRWYTPVYIWRNWVWREPMPFRPGRNESDELLKMACEPSYAKMRMAEAFIRQNFHHEEEAHG